MRNWVPNIVESQALLLVDADDERVVESVDGLRTVDEIARVSRASFERVRTVLEQLRFHGAVVFDQWIEVDECDVFDAPEPPAEVMPLVRRRNNDDSPLVRAILAWVATL